MSYSPKGGHSYGGNHRKARAFQASRSKRSQELDSKRRAPIAKTTGQWMKDPAHSDLEGIDTPLVVVSSAPSLEVDPDEWVENKEIPDTWEKKDGVEISSYGFKTTYPFVQVGKHYDSEMGKDVGFEVKEVGTHTINTLNLSKSREEAVMFAKQYLGLTKLIGYDFFAERSIKESLVSGKSIEEALKHYVDSVEGDASQLPVGLAEYAYHKQWLKKQPHWFHEIVNVPDIPKDHEYIVKVDYKGETQTYNNIGDKNDVAKLLYNSRGRYENIRVESRKFKPKVRIVN